MRYGEEEMQIIRRARPEDIEGITEIYNDSILRETATFDTVPKTLEEQRSWFSDHGERYPLIVSEEEGVIVGWCSLSRWSDRCAYADTAEISLYVREGHRGKGIGKRLLRKTMEAGGEAGLHTVIARITQGNETSILLHEKEGFEHIGVMREVGRKFGTLLDVHLMQKIFGS
jgi:phosphinothricin acetyltransferase